MVRFTSIFALLLLTGCPDEVTPVPPPVQTGPGLQLIDGAYEMRVLDITSVECEGVRPRDLIGESLYGYLETSGTRADFNFEGVELKGSHANGQLSADGSVSMQYDCQYAETDEDADSDESNSSSTRGGSSGGSSGGTSGGADCGEPDPEPTTYSVALAAQIYSERSAIADLSIDMEGCAVSVVVSMAWGPEGDDPVVSKQTRENETGEEEGIEEEPCDEAQEDCG